MISPPTLADRYVHANRDLDPIVAHHGRPSTPSKASASTCSP